MCCALGPADFAHTRVYAGEVLKEGRLVHVLAYQNHAYDTRPRPGLFARLLGEKLPKGNAMLLHFPARAPMSAANIVETTQSAYFLHAMADAVWPPPDWSDRDESGATAMAPRAAAVFDSGLYTVVLAEDARAIPEAIARVPEHKRPAVNAPIFDWYAERFPGWPVALCCFEGSVVAPPPLLWWYEPLREDLLFAPGLDAHDGRPPRLGADVDLDHVVLFGSHELKGGAVVDYQDVDADVRALLSDRVVGADLGSRRLLNGDFIARTADVRRGEARFERRVGLG